MNGTGNVQGSCAVAVPAEPASGKWQPIETAPHDGTPVLVYVPVNRPTRRILAASLHDSREWYILSGSVVLGQPTHWMPLPAPPEITP